MRVASSVPFICGMTTSLRMRSTAPFRRRTRWSASAPSPGLEHGVPALAELAPEHGAHALLIVDDEDDAGAGAVGHEGLRSGRTGAAAKVPRPPGSARAPR